MKKFHVVVGLLVIGALATGAAQQVAAPALSGQAGQVLDLEEDVSRFKGDTGRSGQFWVGGDRHAYVGILDHYAQNQGFNTQYDAPGGAANGCFGCSCFIDVQNVTRNNPTPFSFCTCDDVNKVDMATAAISGNSNPVEGFGLFFCDTGPQTFQKRPRIR